MHKMHKDDFAEAAANPQRRQAAVVALKKRARRFGVSAAVAGLAALALGWDGRVIGGLACIFLSALFLTQEARLHSDARLLEVIDLLETKSI